MEFLHAWPHPFPDFLVGPGEWGWGYMWLMVPSLALPILYHCQHKLKKRPRNEATLSPDTGHRSWSPLHSPSGEGHGQGELSRSVRSPEIELVMKKSTSWRSVSNFLSVPATSYSLASFSIRKWDASLVLHGQWKSASHGIKGERHEYTQPKLWDYSSISGNFEVFIESALLHWLLWDMPTFPVWKMPATDHALCGWCRRSDEGNKLFAYRNYTGICLFQLNATVCDWLTQSFL